MTNVGQHQKQDGRRETGSENILGCTTDTDEIVVLIPKSAGLTTTVVVVVLVLVVLVLVVLFMTFYIIAPFL